MGKQQSGFTLIELVAVIVIIGILAATAIPKFVDLASDAREAKVYAALGSLKSAASMTHAKYLVNPVSPQDFEDVRVTFVNTYPNAASIAPVSGLTSPDYVISTSGTTTTVTVTTDCYVTYTEASSPIQPPIYTTVITGC